MKCTDVVDIVVVVVVASTLLFSIYVLLVVRLFVLFCFVVFFFFNFSYFMFVIMYVHVRASRNEYVMIENFVSILCIVNSIIFHLYSHLNLYTHI